MLLLRKATERDMELVYAWEQNPIINTGFYSSRDDFCWARHKKWWFEDSAHWVKFIITLYEDYSLRDIGELRLGFLDNWCPEIGYAIGEVALWGKGYGREAVKQACVWLIEHKYEWTSTVVKKDNVRSIRLLKSLGFKQQGQGRDGEIYMKLRLKELK